MKYEELVHKVEALKSISDAMDLWLPPNGPGLEGRGEKAETQGGGEEGKDPKEILARWRSDCAKAEGPVPPKSRTRGRG